MGGYRRLAAAAAAAICTLAPAAARADTSLCNEAIRVDDGAVLRANVFLPGDGTGSYPAIVTVTGYNKDVAHLPGTGCAAGDGLSGGDARLVKNGYAVVVVDDRGTGASEGAWDSWSERTKADYPQVIDWLAAQPWSNGHAGMRGGSYMGITSLFMAEADAARVAAGKPRVIDAVFADVPMADAYRDVTFHGGAVDAGFIPLWLGLTSALSDVPPSTLASDPASALPNYAVHLANTFNFAAATVLQATAGTDQAYDGAFYRTRSPIERITDLTIPVAWAGGWWDIFQRGEPLLYGRMVNSAHRTFWMTPNYHGAANPAAWAKQGIGTEEEVTIRWFDHWLKGVDNGADKLPPVNLYAMGANRWEHPADWPLPGTRYTPYYLGDGTLGTAAPSAAGSESKPMFPLSSPCSRMSAQWTAGLAALGSCETDNSSYESGALTYTTAPLQQDTEIAGLVTANVWATVKGASDATLIAVLSDVDPSGRSTQLTAGFLLASQRAVDDSRATHGPGGIVIRPFHPFTRASQKPVPSGVPQQYAIEIYPTANVFKAGHRIRLTIATANTPATLNTLPATLDQLGGTAAILHGGDTPSSVLLPVTDAAGDAASLALPSAKRCVSRRRFTVRLPRLRHQRIVSATVKVGNRMAKRLRGARLRAPIDLRGLPKGRVRVIVTARTSTGRTLRQVRTYRTCGARR
jgi:putative CocE/NonD family hydrolase